MQQPSESGELRCVCSRQPLLAKYGIIDGQVYVHLRVWKQKRIYGELVTTGGEVHILCRECLRWSLLRLTGRMVKIEESVAPPTLDA